MSADVITATDTLAWHQCRRKATYTKKAYALRVARRMRKQTGEDIHAYACDHCRFWHVGHSSGRRVRSGSIYQEDY